MNSQFSKRVSDIIVYSKEEANRLRNDYIGPEHLLLGIIREGEGKAVGILQSLYVDLQEVKETLETVLRRESVTENYSEDITFNEKASKILKMSMLEARLLKTIEADTEHILLAIMRNGEIVATVPTETLMPHFMAMLDDHIAEYSKNH